MLATLRSARPLLGLWLLASLSCGDSEGGSGGQAGSTSGAKSGSTGNVDPTCTATFRVLQKDAYRETAGRTSDLWPPHTTTVFDLDCPGEALVTAFDANHGTEPGAVDANGDVFLVEVASFETLGPKAELEVLQSSYAACRCDGVTQFLSLDSLQEATAEALMDTVAAYIDDNLTCTAATTDELLMLLSMGEIAAALEIFPTCTWAGGASFEEGLDEALTTLLEQTQEVLADYHVCNNDAALQKQLFDTYINSGSMNSCQPESDTCRGPMWLYTP